MAQRVCYLLTSPEKFQQEDGNGSSNTASATSIGSRSSAGRRLISALCSRSVNLQSLPSVDILATKPATASGTPTETCTKPRTSLDMAWEKRPLSLKTLFPPTK